PPILPVSSAKAVAEASSAYRIATVVALADFFHFLPGSGIAESYFKVQCFKLLGLVDFIAHDDLTDLKWFLHHPARSQTT
ncbi:hypothetical protein PGS50_22755, partial [Yersinia intermedia]|uniref:hypothetical protein n=1 Tax=Yersinia intermedia TaxID=631 RepID=UPI0022FE49BE